MPKANLWIISAASGTGKTSLVSALVEKDPRIEVSISHTTRKPRRGEVDGGSYYFVDEPQFTQMVVDNRFLEHANVFGNLYGTSESEINQRLSNGVDVLLEIDWQGAQQVRRIKPDAHSIFIFPPSLNHLRQRLESRGSDDQSVIERRLQEAQKEILSAAEFDYWIINDDFDNALEALHSVIRSNRFKQSVMLNKNSELFKNFGVFNNDAVN